MSTFWGPYQKCFQTFKAVQLSSFAISPNKRTIVMVLGRYGKYGINAPYSVQVWDIHSGKLQQILVKANAANTSFGSIAFSTDGKWVAVGSGDGIIRVWNLASGKIINRLREGGFTNDMRFIHPGNRLIDLGGMWVSYPNIKLWSVEPKRLLKSVDWQTLYKTQIPIDSMSVSLDGKRFFTNNTDRSVQVFDTNSLKRVQYLPKAKEAWKDSFSTIQVTCSPNNKLIAFVRNGYITIRKLSDISQTVEQFPLQPDRSENGGVLGLQFTKTGKQLVWLVSSGVTTLTSNGITDTHKVVLWRANLSGLK